MKKYTFEIVIEEGNDEFWEELVNDNKTGCDEILTDLNQILNQTGYNNTVKLLKYENSEE